MSDINEEFLNDETDFTDLGEVDEEALLQDDDQATEVLDQDQDVLDLDETEDVLDIGVEDDLNETTDDSKLNISENEEKRKRENKFSTERQPITAPDTYINSYGNQRFNNENNNRKPFQSNNVRGGRCAARGRNFNNNNRQNERRNMMGRNKTILINPRFEGVVHVNNNNGMKTRLAWDSRNNSQRISPWINNQSGQVPAQQPMRPQIIQPHLLQQPVISQQINQPPPQMPMPMQMNPVHQYPQQMGPSYDNTYNQQPMYQSPPQPVNFQIQYQQGPPNRVPNQNERQVFMQPTQTHQLNYQSPPPIIINTSQPPPPIQNVYPQQFSNNYQQQVPNNNFPNNYNSNPVNRAAISPGQKRKGLNNFGQSKKPRSFHNNRAVRDNNAQQQQNQDRAQPSMAEERPKVIREVVMENHGNEDEETRKYRQGIEEQKRKREELLRWKEERRKQNLAQNSNIVEVPHTQAAPVRNPTQTQNTVHVKQTPVKNYVQKFVQNNFQPTKNLNQNQNSPHLKKNRVRNPNPNFAQHNSPNIIVTGGYSQKPSKYQQKTVAQTSTNRIVIVNSANTANVDESAIEKKHLSSFLSDRKILAKDQSLIDTRVVLVKNLATSTSDKKIMSICRNIGDVQKLHRDKVERQATIIFKSVASAHAFYKKYQRFMVDLSMIEVTLKPMSELDKTS